MKKSVYILALVAAGTLLLNQAGVAGGSSSSGQKLQGKPSRTKITLPALPENFADSLKRQEFNPLKGRYQVGLGRTFDQPVIVSGASSNEWSVAEDGSHIWSFQVTSEGALGTRLHIENITLPVGASLRVYDPAQRLVTAHTVAAADVPPEHEIWTETVFSQDVVLECSIPAGADITTVAFKVTELSHLFQMPVLQSNLKEGTCHNDVTCFPAFATEASGVARITFVDGGNTYLCSGCLLSSSANPDASFFLTAHHCIPNQTLASSMELYWFYQTSACNGSPPALSSVPHTSGGDLLATATSTDFSFLRLRQAAPGGAARLSWSTGTPANNEALTGIHHPTGSYKRISLGRFFNSDANYWAVQWNNGVTEPGSSGSPLFNAKHEVIGQLNGGFNGPGSSCQNPGGADQYGRFDLTFQAVKQWLGGDPGNDSPNIFPAKGTYTGLFSDPDNGIAPGSSGSVTLTANAKGRFSGKVQLGATRATFSGQFDGTGNAQVRARRGPFVALDVTLQVDYSAGEDRISGTVSDGNFTAPLIANRTAYDGRTTFAPEAGQYTVILPGDHSSTDNPGGDSVGTVTVSKAGRLVLKGFLADGTVFSQSAAISSNGEWPLYVNLYGGRGFLYSWINFSNDTNDFSGSVTWVKQQTTKSKFYKSGFTLTQNLLGYRYLRPVRGSSVLDFSDGVVAFQGGDLADPISDEISIGFNNRVFNYGENRLALTFSASTGLFSGRVMTSESFRPLPFRGVVLQSQNQGLGYFAGSSLTGEVTITPLAQ